MQRRWACRAPRGRAVQVCLHLAGRFNTGNKGGKCVRATAKYTPSFSTLFEFPDTCAPGAGGDAAADCVAQWQLAAGDRSAQWAKSRGLPADRGWAETYNDNIKVDVNLRERSARDRAVLAAGLCGCAAALAAVLGARALNRRLKTD